MSSIRTENSSSSTTPREPHPMQKRSTRTPATSTEAIPESAEWGISGNDASPLTFTDRPTNHVTRVEFRDVTKTFTQGKRTTTALDSISLTIEPGEILGVIGYSGAGKSTLVRMINGLDKPTSGSITLDNTTITDLPERKLRRLRKHIGMIFQQFNLMNSRTAAGNIEYPLALAKMPRTHRAKRVKELLDFVGLGDKGKNYPEQLSGGQKQRVGIARALATDPSLLLADEATSALDPETTQDVLDLLHKVNRELGITIVVITHEMEVVRSIADRVAVMENGSVVEYGPVHEIFSHPREDVTKRFVATALRDTPEGRERESLLTDISHHQGERLVTVRVDDGRDLSPAFALAADRHVSVGFVHGAVNNIQEHSFGRLTVKLTGSADDVEAVVAELGGLTECEEIN